MLGLRDPDHVHFFDDKIPETFGGVHPMPSLEQADRFQEDVIRRQQAGWFVFSRVAVRPGRGGLLIRLRHERIEGARVHEYLGTHDASPQR